MNQAQDYNPLLDLNLVLLDFETEVDLSGYPSLKSILDFERWYNPTTTSPRRCYACGGDHTHKVISYQGSSETTCTNCGEERSYSGRTVSPFWKTEADLRSLGYFENVRPLLQEKGYFS